MHDGGGARVQGVEAFGFRHRGGFAYVGGGIVEGERDDDQIRAASGGKCVDRGAPGLEVSHHLGRDRRREGAHPARGDAMVACEDRGADTIGARALAALPSRHKESDVLKTAKRSGRFRQNGLPCRRRFNGSRVRFGQRGECSLKARTVLEADHVHTKPSGGVRTMKWPLTPCGHSA